MRLSTLGVILFQIELSPLSGGIGDGWIYQKTIVGEKGIIGERCVCDINITTMKLVTKWVCPYARHRQNGNTKTNDSIDTLSMVVYSQLFSSLTPSHTHL